MEITRRALIRWLAAVPAVILARRAGGASPLPEKEYLLNRFAIAGFQYYRGPQMIRQMGAGEELTLAAEPKNSYDPYAVRIERQGVKLGYVPRSDNRHLSRLLQQGARLSCHVVQVAPEAQTWQMVRVEVGMRG